MDKAKVAGALQEYEDAMTEFLTSVRARDTRSDFPAKTDGHPGVQRRCFCALISPEAGEARWRTAKGSRGLKARWLEPSRDANCGSM
jgi:hypothetical protein